MPRDIDVPIFAEDVAHEFFLSAIVRRIATEIGVATRVRVMSARGGHGRAISELKAHQLALSKTGFCGGILVVGIDANCSGWAQIRADVAAAVDTSMFTHVAFACPDPHIERWYLSDVQALSARFGREPTLPRKKCGRDIYKQLLKEYLTAAGETVTLGGVEFAEDIVNMMDIYRASRSDAALRSFVGELRSAFASHKSASRLI
jgi:hypothetical protein